VRRICAAARPGGAGAQRTGPPDGALNLIHTNNSPKQAMARVPSVSYALEWGCSPAVIEAAFAIRGKAVPGGS
jgi:hypothetical protein